MSFREFVDNSNLSVWRFILIRLSAPITLLTCIILMMAKSCSRHNNLKINFLKFCETHGSYTAIVSNEKLFAKQKQMHKILPVSINCGHRELICKFREKTLSLFRVYSGNERLLKQPFLAAELEWSKFLREMHAIIWLPSQERVSCHL